MGKKSPPQHDVTSRIEFISLDSDAWDGQRWTDEIEELDPEDRNRHAIRLYFSGLSRGDLDAKDFAGNSARMYLRPSDSPDVFGLRRLGARQTVQLRDLGGRTSQLAAAAASLAASPSGASFRRGLTEAQLDELCDEYGVDRICELGEFALKCSEAPRPGESKRSGS